MAEELDYIDRFSDKEAIIADKEFLLKQLKEVEEAFNKVASIKLSLNGTGSTKETVTASKEAQKATEDLIKAKEKLLTVEVAAAREQAKNNKQLTEASTKLAAAETQGAKALALVKEELRKKNAEIKNAIREEKSATGSIEQMRAALIRLQREYDNLSRTARNSKFGVALKKEIQSVSSDLKQFEAETNRFQRNVGNYPKILGGLTTGFKALFAGYLGVAGIQKAFDFLSDSVKEFNEAENAASRLNNILSNIGRNDAFERLQGKAHAFMEEFKTVDDDEVTGIFEQLITYGKLTESQITRLTPVIINFAAKQRISLSESASVIIKALEGNGKALKEYGINIKDAGSVSEAFGIIMGDLAPRVEGAAKAFGETTAGQIQKTKVQIGELKEQIGGELQPVVFSFWSGLRDTISGVKSFFEGIGNGVTTIIGEFKKNMLILKSLATFDFGAIKEMANQQQRIEENNKHLAERQQQRAAAEALARDVATKSEKEQNAILAQNQALLAASYEKHQAFVRSGRSSSEDGKKAAREYWADLIKVQKIEEAIAVSRDKRVLGVGGEDNRDTTALKAVKGKFFADELQAEADQQKKLSQIQTIELQTRVNAREKAYELEKEIIERQKAVEIQNEIDKLNAVRNKKSSPNELINATREFNQAVNDINQKAAFASVKIEKDKSDDLLDIRQETIARSKDLDKKFHEETLAALKKAEDKKYQQNINSIDQELARRSNFLATQRDAELIELEKRFQAGKIKEKDYNRERLRIETEYNGLLLQAQIDYSKKLIAIKKARGEDVLAEEKRIKELELQIVEGTTKRKKKLTDEEIDDLTRKINLYRDVANSLADLTAGIAGANTDREKNRIQEEIDAIEKKKEKDIEYTNSTITNAQERAAQIATIEARANARKEALERRQRQLDQERARFEKQANIARIILNTAAAVTTFLVKGSIPEAIAAGAIGAAQLAVAIATPIPKYARGTQSHPGGPMITGDGGKKEFVLLPTGEGYVTDNRPTLGFAPKGTKVYPDADKVNSMMMYAAMKQLPDAPVTQDGYAKMMTAEIGAKLDRLNYTVKNKKEFHSKVDHKGIETLERYAHSWVTYVDEQINF